MPIKRLLALLITTALLAPSASAFRDISPNSTLKPAVESLVNRGVLKDDGRFFRADSNVSAGVFWEVLIRDTGFNPQSATFDTQLPPNIQEKNPLAQFLREAIRRGLINPNQEFDEQGHVTRIQALKYFLKVYGIQAPKRISPEFRAKLSGVSSKSKALVYAEAAYASGLLQAGDVHPLRPYAPLSRRDLIEWIYRYDTTGRQRKSTIRTKQTSSSVRQNSVNRARANRQQRSPRKIGSQSLKLRAIQSPSKKSSSPSFNSSSLSIPNGRVMESVFSEIQQRYRFIEDLDKEKKESMIDAAIVAMVKELGDKYSSYIEPDKSKDFHEGLKGKFEGIGAYVEMMEEKLTITSPITGSPAERAGILPGDIVTHVDGDSIADLSIRAAVALIKGPAGSKVKLTILRSSGSRDITIIRGKIIVPPITLKWKNGVPVIGVHQFNADTHTKFLNLWKEEVSHKNPRGLIIDLRNNPGGLLTSAVKMGEIFLTKGDVIFSVEERDHTKVYKAGLTGPLSKFDNIVILQNKGSASASEIFSGMMQDYKKATIIGSTSLGKGTVQQVLNYQNGGILKLTIAKWITPEGRWIHEKGIDPDVTVTDQTPEERQSKIDRQLDRAISKILRD